MPWLAQEYEGEVHVVPDTEPGHVLEIDCFCEPYRGLDEPRIVTHRDMAQRVFEGAGGERA